jgi:hypothetical protein
VFSPLSPFCEQWLHFLFVLLCCSNRNLKKVVRDASVPEVMEDDFFAALSRRVKIIRGVMAEEEDDDEESPFTDSDSD